MSTLALNLTFENRPVRFVGTEDRPEWVAADVCEVLEIRNPRDALADFDEHEKGVASTDTPGGKQSLATVTEAGLYRLIFKSRKPEAKRFQRWVLEEVLPSIRKYGTYPPPADSGDPVIDSLVTVQNANRQLQAAIGAIVETRRRQIELERAQAETRGLAEQARDTAAEAIRTVRHNLGHFSVLAYCARTGREVTLADAARHGRQLSAICRARGLTTGAVDDPRFGRINTYPESVLREFFAD